MFTLLEIFVWKSGDGKIARILLIDAVLFWIAALVFGGLFALFKTGFLSLVYVGAEILMAAALLIVLIWWAYQAFRDDSRQLWGIGLMFGAGVVVPIVIFLNWLLGEISESPWHTVLFALGQGLFVSIGFIAAIDDGV